MLDLLPTIAADLVSRHGVGPDGRTEEKNRE